MQRTQARSSDVRRRRRSEKGKT